MCTEYLLRYALRGSPVLRQKIVFTSPGGVMGAAGRRPNSLPYSPVSLSHLPIPEMRCPSLYPLTLAMLPFISVQNRYSLLALIGSRVIPRIPKFGDLRALILRNARLGTFKKASLTDQITYRCESSRQCQTISITRFLYTPPLLEVFCKQQQHRWLPRDDADIGRNADRTLT